MNYVMQCRSNYFRVRNTKRFLRWCSSFGLEHWSRIDSATSEPFYAIANDTGEGWPSSHPETNYEVDFAYELRQHLDQRDIAILFQTGAEGLRFITGYAEAIHADGRNVSVGLHSIYDLARTTFGESVTITEASY